jgi:hypothetical protein
LKQTYKQERKNSQQSISCSDPKMISAGLAYPIPLLVLSDDVGSTSSEVGAFYWTDMAPDIVNPGREEQGSVSV